MCSLELPPDGVQFLIVLALLGDDLQGHRRPCRPIGGSAKSSKSILQILFILTLINIV